MFNTLASQIVVAVFYFAGLVCTGLGILNDPGRAIYRIWIGKRDCKDFTRRKYLGFFPYMITMTHYILLFCFSIPYTKVLDVPFLVLSSLGVLAQCALTVTLLVKLDSYKQKLLIALWWLLAVIVAMPVVVITFFYRSTHHERYHILGTALYVSSGITLVVTVLDMRIIRQPDEIKELSVVNYVLGLLGAVFFTVFGGLHRDKITAIRHGINAAMHALILALMARYYRGRYKSPVTTVKRMIALIKLRLEERVCRRLRDRDELEAVTIHSTPTPDTVHPHSSLVTPPPTPATGAPTISAERARFTIETAVTLPRLLREIQELRASMHNIEAKLDLMMVGPPPTTSAPATNSIPEIEEVGE